MLKKVFAIILSAVVLVGFTAGCGKTGASGKDIEASAEVSTESADVSSESTAASAESTASEGQAAPVQDVEEEAVPTPDPKLNADSLIGRWVDINSDERFAKITKADAGYQYEDNDGQYSAEFKDGVLKVKVSDSDTADVYFDVKTGHMFATYLGETLEYSKQ